MGLPSSFRTSHYSFIFLAIASLPLSAGYSECDCGTQVYGEEYASGEIKQHQRISGCNRQHCVFLITPGTTTGLSLSIESITLKFMDTVKVYQLISLNSSAPYSLHFVDLNSAHRHYVFTAAIGVGFVIHSFTSWYGILFGSSTFTLNFERLNPDVKVCPFPLLNASTSFLSVPPIERGGPVRCPFRIVPSVAGRKIFLKLNKMWGTTLFLNEDQGSLRMLQSGASSLHSTTDSLDFVLESVGHHDLPSFNITYKELLEDPCRCNNTDVVVGGEPVYVTSPGFPEIYCSEFRCKRRFLHNYTSHEGVGLTFIVTVHFLSTEKFDYVEFSSGGVTLDRLNGTHENVRILVTDDVMETEFVTDKTIVQHGYNMTIQSVRIPTACLCPHKGAKTMLSKGSVGMDIPGNCTAVYCKWIVPSAKDPLKFAALFNFATDYDMFTVTTGQEVQQYYSISGKPFKRHWQISANAPPTTILYERTVPDGVEPDSKPVSFSIKWMPQHEGCSCQSESELDAVVGEWKELKSPAYPLSYCNNMHCTTMITAPARHHVVLNITDFYTEPYNDVLLLFDGRNISGEHMKMFSGKKQFTNLIRSTNETLTLVFKSDHDISYYGYRLIYSAECNDDAQLEGGSHIHTIGLVLLSLLIIAALAVVLYKWTPARFRRHISRAGTIETLTDDDTLLN
ncbi:hypothetical protein GCK32_008957 [Trichostrongylus colubriformis]|uniref:CUB domain-containing protein n=1 Tax=Trichostrongylus colubriformis TaxID=6319 RepID=A0AAN8FYA0_TRICO